MLVTINEDKRTVTLYGKTVVTYRLSQLPAIQRALRGRQVTYVSETTEVEGEDIISLVEALVEQYDIDIESSTPVARNDGGIDADAVRKFQQQYEAKDEKKWLHATGSGQINVTDPLLTFTGPFDFKPLDKLGYDVLDKYPNIAMLYRQGKLEVVNVQQMHQIRQMESQKLAMQDAMSTSIIVDREQMYRPGYGHMMPGGYSQPVGYNPQMMNTAYSPTQYAPLPPPGVKNVRPNYLSQGQPVPRPGQMQNGMYPQYPQSVAYGFPGDSIEVDSGVDQGMPDQGFKTDLEMMMEAAGMDPNLSEQPDIGGDDE